MITAALRLVLKATVFLVLLEFTELALATPPSESGIERSNYTLTIDPDAVDRVKIRLPEALEYAEDATMSHGTRSPSIFLFQLYTAYPSSNTGWHYHPGIVLVTVAEGSVDWYDEKCAKHVRKAGDFFTEADRQIHEVRNNSSVPARLIITFVIAKGLAYKIPVAAPTCAAPLGLLQ